MDRFFNASPMTGVTSTTTTTTTAFMGPTVDTSQLGSAQSRLMNPMGPMNPMGGVDPMMMMMFQQQQQMTLMLLSMLLGLMMGKGGAGNPALSNLLSTMTGGSAPMGGTGGGGGTGGSSATGSAMGPATTSPGTPTNAPNEKVGRFIDIAKAQQGKPYVFGAAGPDKFDCSGLVSYALKQSGVNIGRMTADGYMQHFKNSRVSKEDLKPGDLIFFHSKNTRGIPAGHATHIEIYLGNGMSMGTDQPSEGAKIEPVNWGTFIGGARVPEFYS